jgi:hypothetical protein
MRKTAYFGILFALSAAVVIGCGGSNEYGDDGVPPDEALARARKAAYADGGEFASLGPGSDAGTWKRAAERYYPPARLDYFEDMDAAGATETPGAKPLKLTEEAVKGRNAWVLWSAGNEAWWDWLARYGYGTIDLLKLIDHVGRESRFRRTGLMNEPGTRPPSAEETASAHGVRYARPVTDDPDPKKVHVEHRKDRGSDWRPADPKVYGYPTGVVGLRLYPNPEFESSAAAQRRWKDNLELYYQDSEAGRRYAAHPDTVRPFRVGMSCGFCHVAPHPLNPPADPERPEWANLSNNIGNQYMRIRSVFGNTLKPDNYLYHVFDSQQPGAVDTSGYPSDNNNNPNTINSFYALRGRLDRAQHNPRETIGADSLNYLRTYVDPAFGNPHPVPRVLLDGSDSVGVHIALSRVYLNIGTHHQQWIRVQNPLLGFRTQKPFALRDVARNSLYWHATLIRIGPMAEFFTRATDPMRLKDAPAPELLKNELRGTGLPWYTAAAPEKKEEKKEPPPKKEPEKAEPQPPLVGGAGDYAAGRAAFARGCIACHSSVQPGDLIDLEQKVAADKDGRIPPLGELPADWDTRPAAERARLLVAALAPRRALRLTAEDRVRLTRGDGQLPEAYRRWAAAAVEQREFWEYTTKARDAHDNVLKDKDGKEQTVTVHNFLSIDERVPVTVTRTNSGRAAATNARHGHVWEDFASQTYKELAPVGPVRYRDPFSGADKEYAMPGGGPGYYRVPTLVSVWATAPFLHNNALGTFNNDPSVKGRLEAFDDAVRRLLWPERRATPSRQWYWDGDKEPHWMQDAWHTGREPGKEGSPALAADRRAADGGWIWRTTEESWLQFGGPHVPRLVQGGLGLSDFWVRVVPWLPALAFLALGTFLLLSERIIRFRERWLAPLWFVFSPVWWLVGVAAAAAAAAALGAALYYWDYVRLLDAVTQGSIWGFRLLVVVLPATFLLSVSILFTLHRFSADGGRQRVAVAAGAVCLGLAVVAALSLGRFLSGAGAGVRLGPIPEGVPINILANFDPDAPRDKQLAAVKALARYLLRHTDVGPGDGAEKKEARRVEFEQTAGPALLNASKCPDYVTDRGHDYEFIRRLSDEEKNQLIALLKTF